MTEELLLRNAVLDPLQLSGCEIYLNGSGSSYKSGKYKLKMIRPETTIEHSTVDGRPAYRFIDDEGSGYRMEYALQDYAQIPSLTCDFHFGIWTYCGPRNVQ